MAKQTAAQKHTAAHLKRREDRLTVRAMPHVHDGLAFAGVQVISDTSGELYRLDCEKGTIRRLRWEQ